MLLVTLGGQSMMSLRILFLDNPLINQIFDNIITLIKFVNLLKDDIIY